MAGSGRPALLPAATPCGIGPQALGKVTSLPPTSRASVLAKTELLLIRRPSPALPSSAPRKAEKPPVCVLRGGPLTISTWRGSSWLGGAGTENWIFLRSLGSMACGVRGSGSRAAVRARLPACGRAASGEEEEEKEEEQGYSRTDKNTARDADLAREREAAARVCWRGQVQAPRAPGAHRSPRGSLCPSFLPGPERPRADLLSVCLPLPLPLPSLSAGLRAACQPWGPSPSPRREGTGGCGQ